MGLNKLSCGDPHCHPSLPPLPLPPLLTKALSPYLSAPTPQALQLALFYVCDLSKNLTLVHLAAMEFLRVEIWAQDLEQNTAQGSDLKTWLYAAADEYAVVSCSGIIIE